MRSDPRSLAVVPRAAGDRDAILGLFGEPDFYFGTYLPDLLDETRIDALLSPGTLVCRAAGGVAGLICLDPVNAGYQGHLTMGARFARRIGVQTAAATITATLDAYAHRRPLRRVSHSVYEFDDRGLSVARQAGFESEGTLAGLVQREGREFGVHCLARMPACPGWPPATRRDGGGTGVSGVVQPRPASATRDGPGLASAGAAGAEQPPREPGPDHPAIALRGFRAGHLPLLLGAWRGDDLLTAAAGGPLVAPAGVPEPPGRDSSRLLLTAPGTGVAQLSEIERVHRTARLTVASLHPLADRRTAALLRHALHVAFGRLSLHRVFGYQPPGAAARDVLAAAGLAAEARLPGHGWAGGPVDRLVWGRCAS
jgi:hypothetical protein